MTGRAPDTASDRSLEDSPVRTSVSKAAATISAALANVPENAAYGLIATAPLGLAFGPTAMALAVLGAVVSNLVANGLGAGRLASGPRSSLALLTAGLTASLVASPIADGGHGAVQVLVCVALALVGAGLLQCAFGVLGLGNLVKYTPYPVRLGLTSGVGLLLLLTALPVMLGGRFGAATTAASLMPDWGAATVGVVALAAGWLAARHGGRIPPALVALCAATALHALLNGLGGSGAWGSTLGIPQLPAFQPERLLEAASVVFDRMDVQTGILLAIYAITVALLCSLDTLIATSIVDGRLRRRRSADRELVAQGIAGIATALCGGHASSPSVARSLTLVPPQPDARHVVLGYALAMLGVLWFGQQWLGLLPESALGGLLVLQGAQMVAPAVWRAPNGLRSALGRPDAGRTGGEARMLAGNWAVTVAVALSALILGLGAAVLIGATCAVLLFVRANMREVVRHVSSGETRRSLRVRPASVSDALRREGHRIVLFELEGSLFFGTADALQLRLQQLPDSVETALLDLRQVQDIDITAARILTEAAAEWRRADRRLVFAEWSRDDRRRKLLEAMVDPGSGESLHFADDVDLGLEQAEERLLRRMHRHDPSGEAVPLAETSLMRGLSPAACAAIEASMQVLRFASGTVIFKVGDPGDGVFVVVQGEVGLRLPGSKRRLASFAAGVTIGEIAVLTHATRSAEAVAESDVTAYFLSAAAFERCLEAQPDVAALLLKNIALHLSDRVRGLTGDLAYWVSRSAATSASADQPSGPQPSDLGNMADG